MTAPDPDRLNDLGKRLDELQTRQAASVKRAPPSQSGIAFRFTTELVASLVVGGGLGWGIDWLLGHFGFHTRPVFLIVFFIQTNHIKLVITIKNSSKCFFNLYKLGMFDHCYKAWIFK